MPTRRNAIRRRLTAMSALSSSFALLLACAAFLAWELITFRKSLVDDLTADARALAFSVTAPLLFDDPEAARTSLQALKAKPRIHSALVAGKGMTVFATYGQPDVNVSPLTQPSTALRYEFKPDRLLLSVPVLSEGSLIGTLTLESSLDELDRRIGQYLLLTGTVLLVALLAALGISSRLQRRIVQPITRLTDAARQVSRNADYSVRVDAMADDELGVLGTAFNDMLAKLEQQKAIREASRLKSEFLANMSHELRTPLNAIIGFTELMYAGKLGPLAPEHHEYLGDILTSARHLLQLINDVLDLAKVESGKMEFRPERVDLARLIGEVRDILRGLAASKRLRVETQLDPDVAFAVVDPARLKQVLYNYVSNAIKFTPEGGRIVIRVAAQGPDLFRLDVEDTGIGIPPEHLGKLFVEFQQLDASAAKKFQGTGLGLALTKRIVEAHGGRVEVRSTPGKGSTFSAILPRAMTAAPQLHPPAVLPTAANRPVLVLDDDPAALKLVETTLRQMGYRSVCAHSAEEALQAAEADPPAIVVSKSGIADLVETLRPFLAAAQDGAHGT
jgi:signal transduction histidine kinase